MCKAVIVLFLLLLHSPLVFAQEKADYVLTNGRIYTVNEAQPWAEAVAIKGNEIIFTGSSADVERHIGTSTRIGDLAGKMAMPGLIDTHLHAMLGAVATSGVWVADIDSVDGVLAAIQQYAEAHPERKVIFGWGYGSALFGPEGPTKELLDQAVADRPAYIVREDGHSSWANSKALEVAGINKDTPDPAPPAGVFGRDVDGNPTGAVNGGPANVWILNRLPGAVEVESLRASALPVLEHITELGITALFDAGAPIATNAAFELLMGMDRAGELPMRYVASHYINSANQATDAVVRLKELDAKYNSRNFVVKALKITTDGVVENRKAALLEPYNDVSDSGALNFTPDTIIDLSVEAASAGYDVYMHTLGDRAVRVGLDAAAAIRKAGLDDTIVTLSHCQLIHIDDFPRFKETGVMINSTGGWMHRYPGEETVLGSRVNQEYSFRPMINDGVLFVNSSDFPATPFIDPFTHLEGSITRRAPGAPAADDPKNPDSALSLKEAIEAYTINGAHLLRMSDRIGSIEVGKLADLIVLDQNITEIKSNQIHKTNVLLTMMDGEVRHDFLFNWGDSKDAPDIEIQLDWEGLHRH